MTTCKSHPRSRKPGMPVAPDGRLRKRGKWRPTPSDGAETAGMSSFGFPGYPMNQPSQHPLDALWQAQTLVWVVLAGECIALVLALAPGVDRSEEHTSDLQSLMRISYSVFCFIKTKTYY